MTPDEAQPILDDAEASLEAGDATRAAALFRAVLGEGPTPHQKAQAEAGLGESSLMEGRPTEAAERFHRAAHLDPGAGAWLHYRLGECWMRAGEWEKALSAFGEALEAWDPADARGLAELTGRRGLARFRSGDKAGETEIREALRIAPLQAPLHADLGDCRMAGRDFPGAEAAYARAAELEPGNRDYAAARERVRAIVAKLAKGPTPR